MLDGTINPNAFGPRGIAHFAAAGAGNVGAGVGAFQNATSVTERNKTTGPVSTKAQADYWEARPDPGWVPPNPKQMQKLVQK